MVVDEEDEVGEVRALDAHAAGHAHGIDGTAIGVALAVIRLARVVQQHGEVEDVGPRHTLQQTLVLREGGLLGVDDFIKHLDADEGVLIGGVAVKEFVLHEARERAKLGEKAAEVTEFVHGAQGAADLALAGHDGEKGFAHGGLVDVGAVDHVELAAQAELEFGPQLGVVLLGEKKDADETERLIAEMRGGGKADLTVLENEAVDLLAMGGVEGKEGPFRLHLAAAAKAIADGVAEVEEQRGALVVVAHEGFHTAQNGAVLVAKAVGDLALEAQRQDVAGALLQVVKLGADAEEEIVGAVELFALGGREQLRIDEGLGVGETAFDFADPNQILIIAQATAPVLDVGLLEERGVADFVVTVALVGDAPAEIFLLVAVNAFAIEGFFKLSEERLVAGEKAGLEQRSLGAQIAIGLGDEIGHGARGVAELEADIPKHVEDVLDEVVDLRSRFRRVVRVKKKNVDVAVGIEFAPAESTHGEQRDARRLFHMREQMRFPRAVPEMPEHDGDDVGALFAEVTTALAVLVLELEAMLLELEEAAVDVEQVSRLQVGLVDQLPLGMAQNFFEIDRRHRKAR